MLICISLIITAFELSFFMFRTIVTAFENDLFIPFPQFFYWVLAIFPQFLIVFKICCEYFLSASWLSVNSVMMIFFHANFLKNILPLAFQ